MHEHAAVSAAKCTKHQRNTCPTGQASTPNPEAIIEFDNGYRNIHSCSLAKDPHTTDTLHCCTWKEGHTWGAPHASLQQKNNRNGRGDLRSTSCRGLLARHGGRDLQCPFCDKCVCPTYRQLPRPIDQRQASVCSRYMCIFRLSHQTRRRTFEYTRGAARLRVHSV